MPVTKPSTQTLLGKARGDLKDAIEISRTVERMKDPSRARSTLAEAIEAAQKGTAKRPSYVSSNNATELVSS
jgi:hypothetical protein